MPDDAHDADAGMPLWVKVGGAVALVLLLVVVALHLAGNPLGGHA